MTPEVLHGSLSGCLLVRWASLISRIEAQGASPRLYRAVFGPTSITSYLLVGQQVML